VSPSTRTATVRTRSWFGSVDANLRAAEGETTLNAPNGPATPTVRGGNEVCLDGPSLVAWLRSTGSDRGVLSWKGASLARYCYDPGRALPARSADQENFG
jgi:hypothetical protein